MQKGRDKRLAVDELLRPGQLVQIDLIDQQPFTGSIIDIYDDAILIENEDKRTILVMRSAISAMSPIQQATETPAGGV